MNKIFKNFAVVTAALAVFSACEEKQVLPPSISVESSELTVTGDQGFHSIPFSIENYVQDVSAEAVSDADWLVIDNVVQGASGSVEFTVSANSDAIREATVSISYGTAPEVEVKVTQYPQGADMDSPFIITVGALTPYSCTVTYTPVNYSGNYFFLVMGAEDFEKYLNNDNLEGLVESDLEWIQYQADYNGFSIEEFLPRAIQVYTQDGKPTSMSYSDLEKETEYYAYCYGLSVSGERQTDVIYKKFKTEIVQTVDMSFTGEATDITRNSATIRVQPSTDEYTYYWTYVSEMDMAQYDLAAIMDNMVLNLKAASEENGIPLEQYLCKGDNVSAASDLWAGTKYSIVAWGMDAQGTPTTQPEVAFTFDTPRDEISDDCTFEVECPQVESMDILIHVTPSNPDTRYYVACVDASLCTGYNDEQMAQRIINMEAERIASDFYGPDVTWENFESLYSGEQSLWAQEDLYWTFKPETMYQIYVFGVNNNGERTTAVKRVDQETAPADESAMTFDVELVEQEWNIGTFRITPSTDDEYWLPFLIDDESLSYYRNADGSLDEKMLVEYIEHYYDNSVNYYLQKGEVPGYKASWTSDMDYTLLLCGWAGSNTTRFYEFKFHTPSIPFNQSDAEVSATYELFDGADLVKLDPVRWAGSEEDCVMYIKFYPNEHAVHWYGGVWGTVDNYGGGNAGIHYLMTLIRNEYASGSYTDARYGTLKPWFDYTWSFSYVAEGADGTFGAWHYEEFTPVRGENMDEAYDFWSNPEQNAMVMSIPKDYMEKSATLLENQDKALGRHDSPVVVPARNAAAGHSTRTVSPEISADRVVKESLHGWKMTSVPAVSFARTSSGQHPASFAVKNN